LFDALLQKALAILAGQLFISFLGAACGLYYIKRICGVEPRADLSFAERRADFEERIEERVPEVYVGLIAFFWLAAWVPLIFFSESVAVTLPAFAVWSLLTGILLAFILAPVDRRLGTRVLIVTLSFVVMCALAAFLIVKTKSIVLWAGFTCVTLLLIYGDFHFLLDFAPFKQRAIVICGNFFFVGWLLVDLAWLGDAAASGSSTWAAALDAAIDVYLDLPGLVLEVIENLA